MGIIGIIIIVVIVLVVVGYFGGKYDTEKLTTNKESISSSLLAKGYAFDKSIKYNNANGCVKELCIDKKRQEIVFIDNWNMNFKAINFSNLLSVEFLKNGISTSSGIGSTIAGGIIAGGVGAIVGSNLSKKTEIIKSISIKIVKTDFADAMYIFHIYNGTGIKNTSAEYLAAERSAHEMISALQSIISANNKPVIAIDSAGELRKYKQLLDDGIITKEEFEEKKKQLLK